MTTTLVPQFTTIDEDRREAWDALIGCGRSFGLLQSWDWGTFKGRFGWRPVRLGVEADGELVAGAQVLIRSIGPAAVLYVPRGPVGAWIEPRTAETILGAIASLASSERAVLVRLEPPTLDDASVDALLSAHGYRPARTTNQPRATIVVDLADGPDATLARMHHKARYNIRRAPRTGVGVRVGTAEDLPAFHEMMRVTGARAGFRVRDLEYYRAQWETFAPSGHLRLFVATHEGRDIAMNVSGVCGSVGAYLHGASTDHRRDLNPNEFLMWEAIQWAAGKGCTTFDLWGIPDEAGEAAARGAEVVTPERPEGLWGVYGFKRRLGQRIELSTRAHDLARPKVLRPVVTRLAARV